MFSLFSTTENQIPFYSQKRGGGRCLPEVEPAFPSQMVPVLPLDHRRALSELLSFENKKKNTVSLDKFVCIFSPHGVNLGRGHVELHARDISPEITSDVYPSDVYPSQVMCTRVMCTRVRRTKYPCAYVIMCVLGERDPLETGLNWSLFPDQTNSDLPLTRAL